jgi:single-strand DNA-binding protein
MSNRYEGTGNLGSSPTLKPVTVDGEQRSVCDFSVYFDRPVKQKDGEYIEKGGFFLNCSLWDGRAEKAVKIFTKGMRVHVIGSLQMDSWDDPDKGPQQQLRLNATKISIDPICLESVVRLKNGDKTIHEPETAELAEATD